MVARPTTTHKERNAARRALQAQAMAEERVEGGGGEGAQMHAEVRSAVRNKE